MTKQEAIQNHRAMWNWMANMYAAGKLVTEYDWKMETGRKEYCEYIKTKDGRIICYECPIKWGNKQCAVAEWAEWEDEITEAYNCVEEGDLLGKWYRLIKLEEIARRIAKLPEAIRLEEVKYRGIVVEKKQLKELYGHLQKRGYTWNTGHNFFDENGNMTFDYEEKYKNLDRFIMYEVREKKMKIGVGIPALEDDVKYENMVW